jgi:hypothetical protein
MKYYYKRKKSRKKKEKCKSLHGPNLCFDGSEEGG